MDEKVPLAATSMSDEAAVYTAFGVPIPEIDRIKIFSASQWEDFTLEWVDSIRENYREVERCGGAGDMGRDIIATDIDDPNVWDNYQCKHYKNGLTPSDVWVELGKLVYYTFIGEYTYPRKYCFIAPQGAGTKLSNLLKKPDLLKEQLKLQWKDQCEKKITSTCDIVLSGDIEQYLDGLDFTIFHAVPPLLIIEQHAKTRWHAARFGGGLPLRPSVEAPPEEIANEEVNYVRALLEVYGEALDVAIKSTKELSAFKKYNRHFSSSRFEFYSAEALRTFSRDTLPPGPFEKLQGLVKAGVADILDADHKLMFLRLTSVTNFATLLPITDNPLVERLTILDKKGICHQLVNDGEFGWGADDE